MTGGLEPPSLQLEEESRKNAGRKVVFVLEQANLEVAKVGKVCFLDPEHSINRLGNFSTTLCTSVRGCAKFHSPMQGYQLLNCDDHASFLRRHGKDPAQYRPDICQQALLAILDSPLAKAGHLKARNLTTPEVMLWLNYASRNQSSCRAQQQVIESLNLTLSNCKTCIDTHMP